MSLEDEYGQKLSDLLLKFSKAIQAESKAPRVRIVCEFAYERGKGVMHMVTKVSAVNKNSAENIIRKQFRGGK